MAIADRKLSGRCRRLLWYVLYAYIGVCSCVTVGGWSAQGENGPPRVTHPMIAPLPEPCIPRTYLHFLTSVSLPSTYVGHTRNTHLTAEGLRALPPKHGAAQPEHEGSHFLRGLDQGHAPDPRLGHRKYLHRFGKDDGRRDNGAERTGQRPGRVLLPGSMRRTRLPSSELTVANGPVA